ncbi:hypothetical protein [Candidatus Methylomicrobium oryzae]|jgi:hypothetical protein|uniref:hypothetical protein n=1 Tax=Candidatus Methylomicrobium oryzae TaxID=2802053 RepID=UPI001922A9EB|nr:hypothetical protein [Methylomicrobium sp. RS1]MBL1265221.1 hypothetical protein [Methylomicrobium sp. RS1]
MSVHYKTAAKVFLQRLTLALGMAAVIPVHSANLPDAQELMQLLGIGQNALAELEQGKTVSFDVAEGKENELAAGVVMYLPASPSKIIQLINKKGLASVDSDLLAQGAIPISAAVDNFKGFGFKAESGEAKDFLQAEPGSEFNLSFQEFESLRNADSTQPDAASQSYRKMLFDRWQSYRKNGLKGIASYDRGNGTEADPGGELKAATQDSKVLARYFPELYKAWLDYPAALPKGADEQFFWLNRKVEGRPTAILGHRIIFDAAAAGTLILARQFYVGHSYNSNQLNIGCLPYRAGSLVFYANRNFTDQVAGLGSSLKHSIGREQMKGEIIKRLTNLRKAIK